MRIVSIVLNGNKPDAHCFTAHILRFNACANHHVARVRTCGNLSEETCRGLFRHYLFPPSPVGSIENSRDKRPVLLHYRYSIKQTNASCNLANQFRAGSHAGPYRCFSIGGGLVHFSERNWSGQLFGLRGTSTKGSWRASSFGRARSKRADPGATMSRRAIVSPVPAERASAKRATPDF